MHGAGTSPAITPVEAICLDLTRLVTRAWRGPDTGIDRVERRYLRECLGRGLPVAFVVRGRQGPLFLRRQAGEVILGWGDGPVRNRLLTALGPRLATRRAVERALAPHVDADALDRLGRPPTLLNVGHLNLVPEVVAQVGARPGARILCLLHDTIPLDHPEWQGAGAPARFRSHLQAVARSCDLAVFPTAAARNAAEPHLRWAGRLPETCVAHLGVDRHEANAAPDGLADGVPVFLMLGTVEPRKNHGLVLSVWERLHRKLPLAEVPHLAIVGARGWADKALFQRIERLSRLGRVRDFGACDDPTVAALMDRSAALLFPSLAEGFGLPPCEAAARRLPVIAAPLPSVTEVLGDYPVYADPHDVYSWTDRVLEAAGRWRHGQPPGAAPPDLPTWPAHFAKVLGPEA